MSLRQTGRVHAAALHGYVEAVRQITCVDFVLAVPDVRPCVAVVVRRCPHLGPSTPDRWAAAHSPTTSKRRVSEHDDSATAATLVRLLTPSLTTLTLTWTCFGAAFPQAACRPAALHHTRRLALAAHVSAHPRTHCQRTRGGPQCFASS